MPVVEDEALKGFGAGGGVAGGGGTEKETFVFPLVDFTGAEEGCYAGAGSDFCGVSGRSPGRVCLDNSSVRVVRVHDAEVVLSCYDHLFSHTLQIHVK